MAEERKRIEIGDGEKGTPPDDAKLIATVKPPSDDEVEGHYRRWTSVRCPHCCGVSDILEETEYRMWFTCCYCGNPFLY